MSHATRPAGTLTALIAAAAGLACTASASAAPIDLTGTKDAAVVEGATTAGGPDLPTRQGFGGDSDKVPYLQFDRSSVTGPIAGATLTFHSDPWRNDPGKTLSWNVYALTDESAGSDGTTGAGTGFGDNWTEAGITWTNAPGNNTGQNAGLHASDVRLLASFSDAPTQGEQYTVSNADLVDFINNQDTDGLLTFLFQRTDTEGTTWYIGGIGRIRDLSGDGTPEDYEPVLALTVPEPASLGLMGVGALCMLARRRRSH